MRLFIVLLVIMTSSIITTVNAFEPESFNKIPSVIVNGKEFTADYSIDLGDETTIKHNSNARLASNLKLDMSNTQSVELKCDKNDRCGTNMAPEYVIIYLTPITVTDGQIARNTIPTLELGQSNCNTLPEIKSLKDCADFDFDIPYNTVINKYKIVVHLLFDESEIIYINSASVQK